MASLGVSLLAAADDVLGVVLQKVDAAALCKLKAASVAWRAHARRELCRRLCRRKQGAITDLDVQVLNDAGRPWEVVVAGRQQPPLARLRGFGFVVNLEAVRQADLGAEEDDDDADAPLGGAALRSCIEGGGEPPRELLLAAVACAACEASGTVRGVPVQWLREDDAIETLYLDDSGIGATSVALLCLMLPAVTSVRSLRCPSDNALRQRSQPAFTPPRRPAFLSVPIDTLALPPIPAPPLACSLRWNWIGEEGTSALAAILKETQITNLKCAAARAFAFVSFDTPTLSHTVSPPYTP